MSADLFVPNVNRVVRKLAGMLLGGGLALAGLAMVGCDDQAGGSLDKAGFTSRMMIPPSSARFKTNVATVGDALNKIERLRGVTFDYKPEYGGTKEFGFIAEEAAEVLPDAVKRDEQGRPCAMNYVAVVPVTVEAIKELSAENAELRARLASLEAAIEKLGTRSRE